MFSHVMVGASNVEESRKFYDEILGVLGCKPGVASPSQTGHMRYFYFLDGATFCISEPIDGNPATYGNGSTIGFAVKDTKTGDAWHAAGLANGGTACEDPPGIREGTDMKMYLAYLRDPAGNKICALQRIKS